MAIKAVIFDVGGVLQADTSAYVQESICRSLNTDTATLQAIWRDLIPQLGSGMIDEAAFWRLAAETYGIRAVDVAENLLGKPYAQSMQPYREVLQLVKELGDSGLRRAVLSNTIKAHADVMRRQSLFDNFDEVLLSYEIGIRKPSPEVFTLALQKLGIGATDVLFIDDLQENIAAAQNLGLQTILAVDEDQIVRDVGQALAGS
jgi:epoxide hydrolase-like predicted phosphatase